MLEVTIEELTKLVIKEQFECQETIITMKKTDFIRFCIKLIKLVKKYEYNEFTKEELEKIVKGE